MRAVLDSNGIEWIATTAANATTLNRSTVWSLFAPACCLLKQSPCPAAKLCALEKPIHTAAMIIRTLLLAVLLVPGAAQAQAKWQEGRNYTLLPGGQTVGVAAGKIEVAEVFSYGCVYCYRAKQMMAGLAASLPPDAAMAYLHASFLPAEAWPMFQRAWYTAQQLGIADATHDAMFTAVWESGEIPLLDAATGRMRQPLPTIEDAAKFYARVTPVKAPEFLKVAASPAVDAQMKRADELVKLWKIPGTPAVVVNGRYLIDSGSLASWDEMRQLVQYLVGLERARLKKK
jgi:thiol:disulfide interchange protein DsbA